MLALLLASWIVSAQSYLFKHLEVSDGLSNNSVNTIYKDRDGFMWFGTTTGLNRYDGYTFKIYQHAENEPGSLPDNYITGGMYYLIRSGITLSLMLPDL